MSFVCSLETKSHIKWNQPHFRNKVIRIYVATLCRLYYLQGSILSNGAFKSKTWHKKTWLFRFFMIWTYIRTKFGRHRGEIKKGRIEVLLNYQSRHLLKRIYTMQYILLQPSTYFPAHAFSRFHWILKYK